MCSNAYQRLNRIAAPELTATRKRAEDLAAEAATRSKKARTSGLLVAMTEDQKAFCKAFDFVVKSLGEVMPHQSHKDRHGEAAPLILLPSALYGTKSDVFRDLAAQGELPPGMREKYFKYLWNRYYPNVGLKRWNPFAKCDACTRFRQLIHRIPRNQVAIHNAIRKQQEEHRQHITFFRKRMTDRDELAKKYPLQFLKILIDGMDSQKCQTPHALRRIFQQGPLRHWYVQQHTSFHCGI